MFLIVNNLILNNECMSLLYNIHVYKDFSFKKYDHKIIKTHSQYL